MVVGWPRVMWRLATSCIFNLPPGSRWRPQCIVVDGRYKYLLDLIALCGVSPVVKKAISCHVAAEMAAGCCQQLVLGLLFHTLALSAPFPRRASLVNGGLSWIFPSHPVHPLMMAYHKCLHH